MYKKFKSHCQNQIFDRSLSWHCFNKKRPQCIAVCHALLDLLSIKSHLIIPILLDLKFPFPLQNGVPVIICELALYCVWSAYQHSRGRFVNWCQIFVSRFLGTITSHHKLWLVNCEKEIKKNLKPNIKLSWDIISFALT